MFLETVGAGTKKWKSYDRPDGELYHFLRAMIRSGEFAQGEKLPSLRQFAAEFHLSVATVQRCIADLENEGLVERVHGSGVFVRSPRKMVIGGGDRRIAVKLERNPAMLDTYCSYALLGAQERAATQNCILEIDYRSLPTRQALLEAGNECDALLLLGANYEEAIQDGVELPCPVVGVEFGDSHGGVCSMLSLDPFQAAGLAVAYFRKLGVKTVTVLHSSHEIHRERAESFRYRWNRMGQCRLHEFQERENIPEDWDWANGAFYITGGDTYDYIAERFRQTVGGDLKRNRRIFSLDGKARLVPGKHPGVCIFPDWREVGRAALDEVIRRIENPGSPPRRILLPCVLE